MKTCTCPHQYTAIGLQRYGTDATCFVHGAPKAPDVPMSAGAEVVVDAPDRAFVPLSPKWCLECGTEHAPGIDCPDYD